MTNFTATWEAKYRGANLAKVRFALADLRETLAIYRDEDTEYTRKLWSEWDFLIVKAQKMEAAA